MIMINRDSEFDVTNTIKVTDTQAVMNAVCDIFRSCYLNGDTSYIERAFADLDNLFEGHFKDYTACDTFYHDKQHTLDMTLALARIIDGHERQSDSHQTFGAMPTSVAIITALFHDSGYIRKTSDQKHANGAEYTRIHVSRSADFLRNYLPMIGLQEYIEISANMVHYTGYEMALDKIKLPNEKFHLLGYMVGTADLIAQMADRCYLEKCRDRLYPEFVLGGLTEQTREDGSKITIYASAEDLLAKTPVFYQGEVKKRLDVIFKRVYEYAVAHFSGNDYYMDTLERNQMYIHQLIDQGKFEDLRRTPPDNPGLKLVSSKSA